MTTLVVIPGPIGPSTITAMFRDIPTRISAALHAEGRPVVLASDSGDLPSNLANAPGVASAKFDWTQSSTWDNVFSAAQPEAAIDRVFFSPDDGALLPHVEAFIDYAKNRGVGRFVILGAMAILDNVGPEMGVVHGYVSKVARIREHLERAGVDFTVLQPGVTLEHMALNSARGIRDNNEVTTATRDGKLYFITFEDIVDAARNALQTEKPTIGNQAILGPRLYSYTEVAEILSGVLGRTVTHKHITEEESAKNWANAAAPEHQSSPQLEALAKSLHRLDELLASGEEEKLADAHPMAYYGKTRVEDWVAANRNLFV